MILLRPVSVLSSTFTIVIHVFIASLMFTHQSPALHCSVLSVVAASKMAPQEPSASGCVHLYPASLYQGWSVGPVTYGSSDMSLPRLHYKRLGLLPWAGLQSLFPSLPRSLSPFLFLGLLINCHVMDTLKHPRECPT